MVYGFVLFSGSPRTWFMIHPAWKKTANFDPTNSFSLIILFELC